MPFKGKGLINIQPKPPDIRIARLTVAIMKSKDLKNYFLDGSEINLACKYVGINTPYIRGFDNVGVPRPSVLERF